MGPPLRPRLGHAALVEGRPRAATRTLRHRLLVRLRGGRGSAHASCARPPVPPLYAARTAAPPAAGLSRPLTRLKRYREAARDRPPVFESVAIGSADRFVLD